MRRSRIQTVLRSVTLAAAICSGGLAGRVAGEDPRPAFTLTQFFDSDRSTNEFSVTSTREELAPPPDSSAASPHESPPATGNSVVPPEEPVEGCQVRYLPVPYVEQEQPREAVT